MLHVEQQAAEYNFKYEKTPKLKNKQIQTSTNTQIPKIEHQQQEKHTINLKAQQFKNRRQQIHNRKVLKKSKSKTGFQNVILVCVDRARISICVFCWFSTSLIFEVYILSNV